MRNGRKHALVTIPANNMVGILSVKAVCEKLGIILGGDMEEIILRFICQNTTLYNKCYHIKRFLPAPTVEMTKLFWELYTLPSAAPNIPYNSTQSEMDAYWRALPPFQKLNGVFDGISQGGYNWISRADVEEVPHLLGVPISGKIGSRHKFLSHPDIYGSDILAVGGQGWRGYGNARIQQRKSPLRKFCGKTGNWIWRKPAIPKFLPPPLMRGVGRRRHLALDLVA